MPARTHTRYFFGISSFLSLSLLVTLFLAACGTSSNTGGGSNCSVDSSKFHLVTSGTLTVASDTTYPPQEFPDPNNPTKFTGSDLDLISEIGKRLCLTTIIQKADFDGIIPGLTTPALGQQRYDLSISAFSITDDRKQKVDMIPYFQAGESLLVAPGNPENITKLTDLCGKKVSVQKGTVELDELNGVNTNSCGATPITLLSFTSQDDVVLQLLNGRVDATYQDSPVTGYYISKNPGKVQAGPTTVAPAPEGIVLRKDNPDLESGVKTALCAMVKDGTYLKILKQWGQDSGALGASDIGC
jgi:polar amino acid transport system substrate-binding protein